MEAKKKCRECGFTLLKYREKLTCINSFCLWYHLSLPIRVVPMRIILDLPAQAGGRKNKEVRNGMPTLPSTLNRV